ncbi:MAG: metallophosphoesterase [Pseudomonadota bacterium]|nr:metallophosphoesterase [Pseudomonadota bacterium]
MRLAAAGDLHYTAASRGALRRQFSDVGSRADTLLLCGDLTDHGLPEEAEALAEDLQALSLPVVAVLGNHDFEAGQVAVVIEVLRSRGVRVLDGESCVIDGVGFVGVKGFGGGFGRRALGPWGEDAIKLFVQEAVDEAMKLERALARLSTETKVVLLHYAPIQTTVEGEAPQIWPFLGSSRLEEPIDRYGAVAAFHGHCHHGTVEGQTRSGTPVYNVAMPLLRASFPGQAPFRLIEVDSRNRE